MAFFKCLLACWFFLVAIGSSIAVGQETETPRVTERERLTAERFLTVLVRRPRPGTALDRVVEFHNRAGTIDTFIDSLVVDDGAEGAGAKAMIAGLVYLRQGKASDAARQLGRATKLMPEDSVASFQHGVALIQIGELEKAADALRQSIERKPARAEAMQVYTTLAQLYTRAGDRTKSIDVWNELQKQFPSDEKIAERIAEELARSGDAEEARTRFLNLADAAKREEDQLRYSVRAAETLRSLGKADQALEELTAALAKTRPGSWLSRNIVSRIEKGFTATGDFEGLAKHYQKQIEANPEDVALPMRLTRIWINLGRLSDAENVARETLKKLPDNNEVRQSLVDVLQAGGKYNEAATVQKEMLQSDPENSDIAFALANTLSSDPEVPIEIRRQRAASVLTAFSERRSDDALLMSQIAQRLQDLDQLDSAIKLARTALEIDPSSTPYREYLGELLFDSGKKDEAISTWRSIAEGERRNRDSLVRLAEIFTAFDLQDLAVEAWDEAGSFDLDFPTRLRWAGALADAELHDRAITVLDNAESIAETPDQRDALLVARINAYKTAGKLKERIAEVAAKEPSAQTKRELAVLYQTDGQESEAMRSITEALELAPQDLSVLTVAADILKRQNRWSEAAEQFMELAKIDRRYQVNHFKQVVAMRIKLGQNDQAMNVCDQIIQSSPGSVDAYTFAARTAQRLSRDDDAIGLLRRAMEVSPRDNAPRMMLASILSGRFDTDAAIELYWEAFDIADYDERSRIVGSLAPLYERRGEVDALVERVALAGRTDRDLNPRRVGLLTADAYQAIRYDGAVLRELGELLLRSPRDVDLLKRAVSSADAADDLETAVDYARRLVEQADTPENRMQLASLQWQSGQIEIDEFLSIRLSTLDSPERIARIISTSAVRGDFSTARKACEFALDKDPSLWDIRLYLAQISLHELLETLPPPPEVRDMDDAEKAKYREDLKTELRKLCNAFRDDILKGETLPPTIKLRSKPDPKASAKWSSWTTSLREFQRAFRVPPYDSSYYQRQAGATLVNPINHQHATAIAAAILMAAESDAIRIAMTKDSDFDLDTACEELAGLMKPWTLEDHESGASMADFLGDRFLRGFARIWADALARQKLSDEELVKWNKDNKHGLSLRWNQSLDSRFAATRIDLEYGLPDLINHIRGRIARGVFVRKAAEQLAEETDAEKKEKLEKEIAAFKPFKRERIEELQSWADAWKRLKKKNDSTRQIEHQVLIWNEWMALDEPELAKPFELVIDEKTNYSEQIRILKWFYQFEWFDKAEKALPIVLETIRSQPPVRDQVAGITAVNQTQGWRNPDRYREFVTDKYDLLLDIAVAQAARSAPGIRNCSPSAEGYFNRSVNNLGSESSYARLRSPLLPSLLPDSLVNDFVYLCDRPSSLPYDERGTIDVPEKLFASLTRKVKSYSDEDLTPPSSIDPYEVDNEETRRHLEAQFTYILAAFVDWWKGQPDQALAKVRRLHQLNPKNIALALELSRLQAENGSPKQAIVTLDSFEVLNSDTLLRKELAILNLASMTGDQSRAARAAERLFGMRMDRNMQMALATQLQQLGMQDKAGEILARARRGRSIDVSTLLSLASSFAASNRDEEAAEVAYEAFKRLSNQRTQQNNEEYYRRRAISILKNSDRLDPIIAAAEKRYEAAPTSKRLRLQLSELYSAAGKTKELEKLFEGVEDTIGDPRAQMAQAENLYRNRKFDESALAYAKALVGSPTTASNEYYRFQNAFGQASKEAKLESIKLLAKLDFSKVESYRISEFAELCSPTSYYGRQLNGLDEEGEKVILQYLENLLLTLRDTDTRISMFGQMPEKYIEKSEKLKQWFETELLKQSTFTARSSTGNITSYSSNGNVSGSLQRIVKVLASKPMRARARESINEALEQHPKPEEGFSADHTAALIYDLLLDSAIAKSSSDDSGELKKLTGEQWLDRLEKITLSLPDVGINDRGRSNESTEVAFGLVWQAGQLIQASSLFPKGERRDRCMEKLYRYSYVNCDQDEFQYTPGPRWLTFATKVRPKNEVRDELWRVIRTTDYFRDDAYNPGYGDYQLINAYTSFAAQFDELDFPIDGLTLLAELTQDASRFERANRWGGGQNTHEMMVDRAKKMLDDVTAKQASAYLGLLVDSWVQKDDDAEEATTSEPSISRAKLATVLETEFSLDFIRAIEVLFEQENADEWIDPLKSKLAENPSGDAFSSPRRTATMEFAVAVGGGNESEIEKACDQYIATLKAPITKVQIVDAASVLRFAGSEDVSRPAAERLLTHMIDNLEDSQDLELQLRRLLQSEEDRQSELITSIESAFQADPEAKISTVMYDECLRYCLKAAEEGRIKESAEIAELMLKRGLPIRATTQSNMKDAFAIRQNSRSMNPSEQLNPRLNDVDRILDLADLWGEALKLDEPLTSWPKSFVDTQGSMTPSRNRGFFGFFFGASTPASSEKSSKPLKESIDESTREAAMRVYTTLTKIQEVAPGDVASGFGGRLMSDSLMRYERNEELEFRSLEIARTRLAMSLGIVDRLEEDASQGGDDKSLRQLSESIERAHAQLDEEALSSAIERLSAAMDTMLPAADEVVKSNAVQSYTTDMLTEAAIQLEPLDAPLRVLLPVANNNQLSKKCQRQAIGLCKRMLSKMKQQKIPTHYIDSTMQMIQITVDRLLEDASGDELSDEVAKIIREAGQESEQYIGNDYAPQYFASKIQMRMASIFPGGFAPSSETAEADLEQFIEKREALLPLLQASWQNYSLAQPGPNYLVFNYLASIGPKERVEFLSSLILDPLPDSLEIDPTLVASAPRGSLIALPPRYTTLIPEFMKQSADAAPIVEMDLLRQQLLKGMDELMLPRLEDEELYPFIDMAVILADSAAECGQTNVVADKLRKLAEEPGDAANCLLALVLQADAIKNQTEFDELVALFDDALEQIKEQISESDGSPYASRQGINPAVTTMILRAHQSGIPRKAVLEDWDVLKEASNSTGYNINLSSWVSEMRRLFPLNGFSEKMPLEGFTVTDTATYMASSDSNRPLFHVEGDVNRIWAEEGRANLIVPFPVVGEFKISYEATNQFDKLAVDGGKTPEFAVDSKLGYPVVGLDLSYGDVTFQLDPKYIQPGDNGDWLMDGGELSISVRNESSPEFLVDRYRPTEWTTESMSVTSKGLSAGLDGTTYVELEGDFSAYPWIELETGYSSETIWKNLRIEGEMSIPRYVDLINDRLIGFSLYGPAELPEIKVPEELLAGVGATDEEGGEMDAYQSMIYETEMNSGSINQGKWSVNEGLLQLKPSEDSPTDVAESDDGLPPEARHQTILTYGRPLLEGEKLQGEFRVEESSEKDAEPFAYLQVANVVITLSKSGITAGGQKGGRGGAPGQNIEIELTDGTMRDGWNQFEVARREGRVYIMLNEEPLIDFEILQPLTYGFGGDVRYGVDFKTLRLTGPWPETVPEAWKTQP